MPRRKRLVWENVTIGQPHYHAEESGRTFDVIDPGGPAGWKLLVDGVEVDVEMHGFSAKIAQNTAEHHRI